MYDLLDSSVGRLSYLEMNTNHNTISSRQCRSVAKMSSQLARIGDTAIQCGTKIKINKNSNFTFSPLIPGDRSCRLPG